MKKLHYIALFHPIKAELKTRLDFDSELKATSVFDLFWQEGYKIYQLILPESQYIMPVEELKERKAKFDVFEKERRTWFGLSSTIEQELLIYPEAGFYYPYSFGNYFYLFSKEDIKGEKFISWINQQFPNRWYDFDDTLAGVISDSIELLNNSDYILITNRDFQNEFGITAQKEICELLIRKLEQSKLENFEIEEYIQPQ